MRRPLAVTIAAVAAAGCGGESEGDADGRWKRDADAACRQAQSRIEGSPADALTNLRAAIEDIAPPEGSEARAGAFVEALNALESRVREVDLSESRQALRAVDQVHGPAEAVSRQARRAGLRVAAMRRAQRLPDGSPSRQAAYLRGRWIELGEVLGTFGELYPPAAAAKPLGECMDLIERAKQSALELSTLAIRGRAWGVEKHFYLLGRRQATAVERTLYAVS